MENNIRFVGGNKRFAASQYQIVIYFPANIYSFVFEMQTASRVSNTVECLKMAAIQQHIINKHFHIYTRTKIIPLAHSSFHNLPIWNRLNYTSSELLDILQMFRYTGKEFILHTNTCLMNK